MRGGGRGEIMKPELYSCLKMLESFRDDVISTFDVKGPFPAAYDMSTHYSRMRRLLKKYLNPEQMKFVPFVTTLFKPADYNSRAAKLQELISASGIVISYLRSLDGSLDKEMEGKIKELELREKEIESKEKLVDKTVKNVKQLLELSRSRAVEETKKSHRGIEKHSRKGK